MPEPIVHAQVAVPFAKMADRRKEGSSYHVSSGAPASTVEALAYSLRRGLDALAGPDAVCRLAELRDDQLLELGERLRKFKPEIARAWSADDVAVLMQVRERLK